MSDTNNEYFYDDDLEEDYEYDGYDEDPCETCGKSEWCDGWDARYCCTRCQYLGGGDCEDCDPWDI